jgi:hypothetical protein
MSMFEKVHLQWFGEGDAESQGKETEQGGAAQGDHGNEGKTGGQSGDPKTEVDLRAELTKLQGDLLNFKKVEEERKTKEKKRQEELLKEQGKFRELYETAQRENDTMKAKLERLDVVMKGMLEDEMKDLPTDFDKTLSPSGEPFDQIQWLRKAKPVLIGAKPAPRGDGAPAPKPGAGLEGMRSIYNNPTSPKH